jgi:hypothetical protein
MMTMTTALLLLAAAQQPGSATPWRAGLGLGVTNDLANGPGVGLAVIAERRVSFFDAEPGDTSALFVGITGSGSTSIAEPDHDGDVTVKKQESYDLGADVNGREVFNQGDPIEISLVVDVGAAYSHAFDPTPANGPQTTSAFTVGGALGLALEHWFTPVLGVRASSAIVHASTSLVDGRANSISLDENGQQRLDSFEVKLTGFTAGISLLPTISVVGAF